MFPIVILSDEMHLEIFQIMSRWHHHLLKANPDVQYDPKPKDVPPSIYTLEIDVGFVRKIDKDRHQRQTQAEL